MMREFQLFQYLDCQINQAEDQKTAKTRGVTEKPNE